MENPGRVLIIDDEPSVSSLLRINLEHRGFAVTTALSAEEGIRAADSPDHAAFDLVVIDVVMPHTCGIQACRSLRALPEYADVPILMISSRADTVSVQKAKSAGASDYLPKPFTFEEFMRRADILLSRPFSNP